MILSKSQISKEEIKLNFMRYYNIEEIERLIPTLTCSDLEKVREELKEKVCSD